MSTKTCKLCKEEKSLDQFYDKAARCKKCHNQRYTPEQRKYHNIWTRYRLRPEQYDEMAKDGCIICGSKEKLCVDHDHSCCPGRNSCGLCVRGILCEYHNVLEGQFPIAKLKSAEKKLNESIIKVRNRKKALEKAKIKLDEAEQKLLADTKLVDSLLTYKLQPKRTI